MGSSKCFQNNDKLKNKHREIASLARSKLSSIKKIISKTLASSDISHEEFKLTINEEQIYLKKPLSKR